MQLGNTFLNIADGFDRLIISRASVRWQISDAVDNRISDSRSLHSLMSRTRRVCCLWRWFVLYLKPTLSNTITCHCLIFSVLFYFHLFKNQMIIYGADLNLSKSVSHDFQSQCSACDCVFVKPVSDFLLIWWLVKSVFWLIEIWHRFHLSLIFMKLN